MKRSYIIILSIQFVILIVVMLFALIQKAEADVQRQAAQANAIEAQQQSQAAIMNRVEANQEKHRADSLQQELDTILQKRK
jgi:choline-glycine betaine transporter